MSRIALIVLAIAAATPALAMDLPLLTFPEAPPATTTSTSNGK